MEQIEHERRSSIQFTPIEPGQILATVAAPPVPVLPACLPVWVSKKFVDGGGRP